MRSAKLLKLLYVQVLIGLVLGIAVGHWWPEFGAALKPLGDGFVKLVKMMIAPIVFCTIVSGITSLNDSKQIGKTLLKSMGLFYALTILALLTGLAAVFLLQPGAGMHIDPKHLDAAVAGKYASQIPPRGFTEFVLHIIPNSFFGAFADGDAEHQADQDLDVEKLEQLGGFHGSLLRAGMSWPDRSASACAAADRVSAAWPARDRPSHLTGRGSSRDRRAVRARPGQGGG